MIMRIFTLSLIFFTPYLCNVTYAHEYGQYKIGYPYQVKGTQYTPRENNRYQATGLASWYGKNFNGKKTANGAIFNSNLHTAAHRTLPMPSAVLITNLSNNKHTIAIINDRGPFIDTNKRIIDVSRKIAEELDFINKGHTEVKVEYLPDISKKLKNGEDISGDIVKYINNSIDTKLKPAKTTRYIDVDKEFGDAKKIGKTAFTKNYLKSFYIQVGVFADLSNAQRLYKTLSDNTKKMQIRTETLASGNYYVVRSGPHDSINIAEQFRKDIDLICADCHSMLIII